MPTGFFNDRELMRELQDGFPAPLADVFDDLTYERNPRGQFAKLMELFRVGVRLLAFYALAATAADPLSPEALVRLRKLLRQRLSEGDWIGLARETVRPFAWSPAPFPVPEIASIFFLPSSDQSAPGAPVIDRLLQVRNEWAHGTSGTEAEAQALVQRCLPDLEAFVGQLRWMTRAPWFVPDAANPNAADSPVLEGRQLSGATPRRGFRQISLNLSEPLQPGTVYAVEPTRTLCLGPLVQLLAAPDESIKDDTPDAPTTTSESRVTPLASPELFLLEAEGRREAQLKAFPSGREVTSREALEWLVHRTLVSEEPEERGLRWDVPMVGRHSECTLFHRLLRRATNDRQGQMLVIEGEAGIGKTKFVQFCREAVAPLQVRVMHGTYRDHAGDAYAGVREALAELFGVGTMERDAVAVRINAVLPELGYADIPAETADVAGFLTKFLRPTPGVGEWGTDGEAPDPSVQLPAPRAQRTDLIERIERFLRRASLHVPLLFILEDLHWADAESLILLQHLVTVFTTSPARLLIIATMRAKDREPNPALEATLPELARFDGIFYRHRLTRLREANTSQLVEKVLQADLEDKASVYHVAEGNPLHVLGILRYLDGEQLLEAAGTGWRVKPGIQLTKILPPTVREVIGLRVQRLIARDEEGPARRETLLWAAAAGRRFDSEVLSDATREGAPHLCADLDIHLDALLGAGLLRGCPSLPGDVLEFDHHLLREVVLAEQQGQRAERKGNWLRHRCLARAKLHRVERGNRSLLPEVAYHYLQAREWAEAVRYHKLAGDAARDSLAFVQAAELYETAVRLMNEQHGLLITAEERAELYEMQAETQTDLGRTDEALAAHRAAQEQAGGRTATEQWARVRWGRNERSIGFLLCLQGRLDEAAAACERAREVLEAANAELDLADALRSLGMVETYRRRYDVAISHLQPSLSIYQRLNHREGQARCYGTLAHLYQGQGDLQAMRDAAQRSLAIWQDLGRPVSVGRALNNAACVFILLGRAEEALPLLFRAVDIFEVHRNEKDERGLGNAEKDLPNVYHSLAEALLICGRGEEARPYLQQGLEIARRVGEVRTVAEFHRLLARQAAAAGHATEARTQFEEALRVCAGTDLEPQKAQICLEFGEFLIQAGEPAEALRLFEEAMEIRQQLGTNGVSEAETAVARAREAICAAETVR
jgi:tetratricopeptide (TPR) repeat protein